ncbi:Aspartic peptidase [Trema orientale]|uniref:Aspartic peptidase n=1 Tax=Trema orientale TaxID=63057 RepID=A0A2P5D868_TREOI|nr:Aspartic peptidase [Trema orientale]
MASKTINKLPLLVNLLIFILMITVAFLSETHAFNLSLIRIDSIDSPLFPKSLTKEERHKKLSRLTLTRARLLRTMAATASDNPNALRPPVYGVFSNFYVTQMRIGSQNYSPYLMLDSGCDDTWVQCEGCTNCFQIKGGSFKYRSSSTFSYLPCEHPLCVPKQCQNGHCTYAINYVKRTSISGVVSTDTFSFRTDGSVRAEPYKSFPNIAFGCGFDNRNVSFGDNAGPDNAIAGIFGLGPGQRSILWQLESQTNGLFSYCLPSWTTPYSTTAYLRFGNDAKAVMDSLRGVQRVRMVQGMSRYSITLIDISVNGKRLHLNPSLFRGKFAIDSGAPYTALLKDAYTIVRNEMVEYFQRRYSWRPLKDTGTYYDLCYNKFYRSGNYSLPTMSFQLDGATLFLKPENLFEEFSFGFCLIMLPIGNAGPGLLGAFQQSNFRFLYDVKALTLSFAPQNCQNN